MQILWRYLLRSYLQSFLLSVSAFVSVLIVSRFKEIARFAALSGDWPKTGLFTLYQIPFILPLAIPISALVASYLLFQRLSKDFELVAFRASGLGFRSLLFPPLAAAFFLACFNLSCCADIAPFSWRESKALLYRETSANPLLLMQRQNLVKAKHAFLKMEVSDEGKKAEDFLMIAHNESNDRLNLVSAKTLRISKSKLIGTDFSILSHLYSNDPEAFDPLILENQAEMSTAAPVLSAALNKNRPRLDLNSLSIRMLRLRCNETGKHALAALREIIRRASLSLAAFSFTLLGCAFGMQAGRIPSKKGLAAVFCLATLTLIAYLSLKTLKVSPAASIGLASAPHLCIFYFAIARIQSIAGGRI